MNIENMIEEYESILSQAKKHVKRYGESDYGRGYFEGRIDLLIKLLSELKATTGKFHVRVGEKLYFKEWDDWYAPKFVVIDSLDYKKLAKALTLDEAKEVIEIIGGVAVSVDDE